MGKPYSVDLRLAVVRSVESGYTREEAAELHGEPQFGGSIPRARACCYSMAKRSFTRKNPRTATA
jgi:hypothetical protein